jgi:hypothetical protein
MTEEEEGEREREKRLCIVKKRMMAFMPRKYDVHIKHTCFFMNKKNCNTRF